MEENKILIYVKRDENNSIIEIKSNIFIDDLSGWEQIDEFRDTMLLNANNDMRYIYAHADNGEYVQLLHKKPLYDENGIPNFHDDWVEWTEEEKTEKYPIPKPQPSELEKLKAEQEVTAQALQELMMVVLGGGING